jgi:hypothetical protein
MNPHRFLSAAGPVLITLGLLGLTHVLGKISSASFFHPPYWINWVHLSIGSIVLGVAAWGNRKLQASLTLVPAVLGTTLGVSGLLFGSLAAKRFNIPELADPSDHMAHLTVGLLALWGWLGRKSRIR